MAALPARDVHAVLELVGEIHHAESLDEFRAGVLPAVKRLVPCEWVSYNEVGADGTIHAVLVDPIPPSHLFPLWDRYALQNPIVAFYQRTHDGRAYRFSDFLTRAEYHALELYQHVYGPLGVEYQVAIAMPSPPDLTIGIALSRKRGDFSQRDRDVLDLARPHLIQAWRNAQRRGPAAERPAVVPEPERLRLLGMSKREAEVLQLLMQGSATDDVAATLGISPRTVHKHSERIREKLGVHSRAAVVAAAWSSLSG